jgi:hypothetical protein
MLASILIYRSLLFWLALLLPGYVVVRAVFRRDLHSGLLGTLAVANLATWGLLSPVSILCYVFRAPVWVFSTACSVAILAAVFEITRRRWWGALGKLLIAGSSVALLIVALDMIASARVGAFADGDARVHLARIRFLLDYGFNNDDPFVAVRYFFPLYHTNLHHALYAACAQVTYLDHHGVWWTSLAWGKLLAASGAYYMAWCLFENRWAACGTAVFAVLCQAPLTFLVYPNKLAPLWVIPVMIGSAVQAGRSPCPWQVPAKIGIGSLVLGQLHGLYAAFAGLLLGPPLGALAGVKLARRRPGGRWLACCVLALGVALPFVWASEVGSRPRGTGPAPSAGTTNGKTGRFVRFENGWVMHNPRHGIGSQYGWRAALLAAGAAVALRTNRRKEAGVLLGVVGTAAALLYIPPVCSILLRLAGREWILARLQFAMYLGFIGFVPAVIVFLMNGLVRTRWVLAGLTILVSGLALPYAWRSGTFTWSAYGRALTAPKAVRTISLWGPRTNAALLAAHVPAGSTVLVRAANAAGVVAAYDCHVVASNTASNGVVDQAQRRKDLARMLARKTPWPRRRALLRQYGVTHYVAVRGETLHPWLERAGTQAWQGQGLLLIALDTR